MVTVSSPWTLDVVDNGITSLGESCDGQDPILSLAQGSCSSYAKAFLMSSIISLDHEIVQLPDTVGMLWVCQTSQCNWVAIKAHYRCLRNCLLGWHESKLGFVTPCDGEVSLGPLGRTSSLCAQCDQGVDHGMMCYGTSKETCR